MLGHTTIATPTMLAAQRFPNHAIYAKVFFVKLPQIEKLGDHRLLLVFADQLWDIAGILHHREGVEVECQGAENREEEIEKGKGRICRLLTSQQCFRLGLHVRP